MTEIKKAEATPAKRAYKLYRGGVRALTVPARRMSEGAALNRLRCGILNYQHSLPTELVVRAGDTVVQVGTPNPQTMRRFARTVGPNGRLVIVEAMPENQARLQAAIDADALGQVTLVRAAACNESKMGELAVSPLWGDHKIPLDGVTIDNDLRAENSDMHRIPVQFVRLDDVLAELGIKQVDYLSVTVNGAEAEVVRGARETLQRGKQWSRVYTKGHALDENGRPIHEQVVAELEEIGFRTKITHGEPAVTQARRAGDVYAWRP